MRLLFFNFCCWFCCSRPVPNAPPKLPERPSYYGNTANGRPFWNPWERVRERQGRDSQTAPYTTNTTITTEDRCSIPLYFPQWKQQSESVCSKTSIQLIILYISNPEPATPPVSKGKRREKGFGASGLMENYSFLFY